MSIGSKVYVISAYVFILLVTLIVLIPLLYILQVTFSSDVNYHFRLLPKGFSLQHYVNIFRRGYITTPFLNSVYVTGISVAISMVLTMFMAYPLSRKEFFGRRFLNVIVLIPMLISLGFLPSYMLVKDLGLMNTYAALIFPGAISTFNLIILRNFFASVPESLIESARLDGASETRILLQVVFPLSMAAIATIALFYLVANWNEYFNVVLYINTRSKYTLQVILRQIVMENESMGMLDDMYAQNMQYATIVVAIIPIMVVYPLLQRYFTKGIMLGSVKG